MATDSTAGSIAGAAVTTLGNAAVAAASNRRQYKNQIKAMEQQQAYNKELWDYQNAYNTPQAQMQRLQDAGLNPRLIYGAGSAGGGNAGSIAPTDVPARQAISPQLPDLWEKRLAVRQADAQYAATTQSIDSMKQQASLREIEIALKNLNLMKEGIRSKNYGDLAQAELDTQKFVSLRSAELFANERKKGNVMDQLIDVRGEQLKGTQLDNIFKQNRNDLARLGIYSSDDAKLRMLVQAAKRMNIDLDELIKSGYEKLKYLFE